MYVQVAVNVPGVSGVFDYQVLPEMEVQVLPGCLVIVPFGKQMVQGFVLKTMEYSTVEQTRPVASLVDPEPVFTPAQIELAGWLSHETLSSLSQCLALMLPPGMNQQVDTLYTLNQNRLPQDLSAFPAMQQRLISLLKKRGDLRGRQLDVAFPQVNWKASAQSLLKKGIISSSAYLNTKTARPKTVRTVQLSCAPQALEEHMGHLGRGEAQLRRQKMMEFLVRYPWGVEATWVYAASAGNLQDLYSLEKKGLVTLTETEVWRDPLQKIDEYSDEIPVLTSEQNEVWQQVKQGIHGADAGDAVKPFLLNGVTGSGKTEIYLRAVEETLALGKQIIILAPEISLTPQTVRRFMARFPGKVGLVHSRLSAGERYDTWRRARQGLLQVIVGPRSALFTPLKNIGLIVVDEFDDDSYYQMEGIPRYHAVSSAVSYAGISGGVVLLGSATPDITSMYRARQGDWLLLQLPQRVLAHRKAVEAKMAGLGVDLPQLNGDGDMAGLPLPEIKIVDMREELKAGNRSIFSASLQRAMRDVLEAGQQAVLYLNRRGAATYVFCRDCGTSLRCPRCEIPLTFHRGADALVCHTCNYQRKMPQKCPTCGSERIRHFGTGTEKVEEEISRMFPQARIIRWDAETTRQKDSHEILMSHFANHRADILVGTQMLAKGMDVPLVTLVGVVLADVGLNFPDYRAPERVYQLLTQVSGRAGRSPLGGQAILQTFQPEHYVIKATAAQNYEQFYQTELGFRRKLRYPPFYRLARLEVRGRNEKQVRDSAQKMAQLLNQWIEDGMHTSSDIIGPVPCYFGRLNGLYRWQVILRSPDPLKILRGRVKEEWRVEIDPPTIL